MIQDLTRASLELLYNISRELSTTLDLRTVLSRVLYLSVGNVAAERGTLIALDDHLEPVDAAIIYGQQLIPYSAQQLQATLDQGLAGWVLRHHQAALVPDTSLDPRWLRRPDDSVDQSGAKSAICVLLSARDKPVGILTIVHSVPGFFTQEHLALLQSIADQAGIAIYNARLVESLETATRRYRELFDDSIDTILITDQEGHILEANRQATESSGYTLDDLQGKNIADIHAAQWDLMGSKLEILDAVRTVSYEATLWTFSGQNVPLQVYVRKVQLASESYLQWTLRDISERKKLASLQEDLTATIYHDLRSPLANIVSSIDMLETMLPMEDSPEVLSVFGIAKRSTDRMQRLISSLLDINRLEAGQPISNQQSVSLEELFDEASEAVIPVIESKGQSLGVHSPDTFPRLWADADMIKRVLINLLENGVKFTPLGGHLDLGADLDDGWARLWIQDSGPGVPTESRERIFDKFVRLHSGTNIPKGLGLGLAFCRLAIQAHGGKIWVESPTGEGSRFIFTLPLAPETP